MPNNALRDAIGMLPGAAPAVAAGNAVNRAQQRAARQPNSRQHAQNLQSQQAARDLATRRARIGRALQAERQRAGQQPMSQRELDAATSEYR